MNFDVSHPTAVAPSPAGRFTRLEQLGAFCGEIVRYSEPLSSLSLLTAAWCLPWHILRPHIPEVPGVYLLVKDKGAGKFDVDTYVGESETGAYRLHQQHADLSKHGYRRLFCLTAQQADLNKAHVLALEKIANGFVASRAGMTVTSKPRRHVRLGAYDEAIVSEAWSTACRLLDAAGFPVDPPGRTSNSDPARNRFAPVVKPVPAPRPPTFEFKPGPKTCFSELRATLVETTSGAFEIQPGAIYRSVISHELSRSIMFQRRKMVSEGLLEPVAGLQDRYRLLRPAACVLTALAQSAAAPKFERAIAGLWKTVGNLIAQLKPAGCANYSRVAGCHLG